MSQAVLAVPGDLDTPTGGYVYARRLLAEAERAGWPLGHLALPDGFPAPGPSAIAEAVERLRGVKAGTAIIVDGLALGALPADALRGLPGPLVALCHHPLARETGLSPAAARRYADSERAALAEAQAVIATSAATAEELGRDYGVDRVAVAPPGTEARAPAVGSGGAEPLILSVGSLTPRKGHDVLVRALARNDDLSWRCRIVGAADRDRAEADRIAALIARTGLVERFELVGALDDAALARAYARADLFALASRHEGFGMVFAEAVAHGLPVLGPALPAVAEATAGGALLLPPDQVDAWAGAFCDLLGGAERRAALSARAREAAPRLTRWPDTLCAVRDVVEAVAGPVA